MGQSKSFQHKLFVESSKNKDGIHFDELIENVEEWGKVEKN
jgi:hypothetical protein